MTVIATDVDRFSNIVKMEFEPASGFCREVVTVNIAAGATLVAGTVLAKVTATGKYIVQDSSLSTGAGLEAAGVLLGSDELNTKVVCAAATDTKVLMLARGPARVAKDKLVMGAGTDTAAEKAVVYATLAGLGIVADTQL